jgi:hypothetical protein
MRTIKLFIYKHLIWKQSLNFVLSQFPPLLLCSIINMLDLRLIDEEKVPIISSKISIIILVCLIIVLTLIFGKVWIVSRDLNKEKVI